MQLFKSEWLREPRYAPGRDARAPGFVPRYGVRIERDGAEYRPPVCAPEVLDVPVVERDRAVLWDIARYDRAA
jgi:hypothetical protein